MKTEEGDPRMDRLRAAGYDPERMTHAEVVEAIERGLLPDLCPVQIPQPKVTVVPVRMPCPHPRVLRPCERPPPSRVGRLAPSAIAALIGFCAGADPSFEAFNRDRERGRK